MRQIALVLLLMSGLAGGTATAAEPQPAPPAPAWAANQKVDVKWGGMWFESTIVRKQGEWYLVQYAQDGRREWVEPWRIRKLGSKEDNVGHAQPHMMRKPNEGPPAEKPGPAPAPFGAGRAPAVPAPAPGTTQPASAEQQPADHGNDPAYKQADWSAVQKVNMDVEAGQQLAPDAVEPGAAPASSIALKGAQKDRFEAPSALAIARGATPYALVGHVGMRPDDRETSIEKVNLATGQSLGVWKVPGKMLPMDISADGKSALLRSDETGAGKHDRLEIWSIEAAAGKRTLLFYPHGDAKWPERDIEYARFVGTNRLLTVNRRNQATLWDLPACKALYSIELALNSEPALSPSGKYVAFASASRVAVMDPQTGQVLAALPAPHATEIAFSPSGKRLAAYGSQSITAWNLATGQVDRQFSIPAVGGRSFALVSDSHALLDNSILVDLERRTILWKYETRGAAARVVSPAGVFWHTRRAFAGAPATLASAKLPDPAALAAGAKLNPDELLLLKPGTKVALSVSIAAGTDEMQKVTKDLEARLADAKLVRDDKAPIRIVASTESGKTVEREYRTFGAGPFAPTQKVTVTEQIAKVSVEADGKPVWETRALSTAGPILHMKEGETIQQAAENSAKPNLGFFSQVVVPSYLAKPREPAWYGTTTLGE